MAGKNCPVCGGFLKQGRFRVFRCTRCLNRCKAQLAGAASLIGRNWILLLAIGLILAAFIFGPQVRIAQLEETVVELGEANARLEEENASLRTRVRDLEEELDRSRAEIATLKREVRNLKETHICLKRALAEKVATIEELRRSVEELQQQPPPPCTVVVQSGDTVWELLTVLMGHYPCAEQIQRVVDANGLESFHDSQGRWIVLIYPGQVLDLSPALGG